MGSRLRTVVPLFFFVSVGVFEVFDDVEVHYLKQVVVKRIVSILVYEVEFIDQVFFLIVRLLFAVLLIKLNVRLVLFVRVEEVLLLVVGQTVDVYAFQVFLPILLVHSNNQIFSLFLLYNLPSTPLLFLLICCLNSALN